MALWLGPWPRALPLGLGALGLGLGSSAVVVTVNCSDLGFMHGCESKKSHVVEV